MNQDFIRSKEKKETLKIYTDNPDGDDYDGIILGVSNSILIFQDTSEFELEGISILPLRHVRGVRNGWHERVYDKVLSFHNKLENINKDTWAHQLSTLQEALSAIKERNIWPSIEIFDGEDEDDTLLYMGKITKVTLEGFSICSYDSLGNWEKEEKIAYEEVFCIQLFNKYTERFNDYMKSLAIGPP